MTPTVDTTSTDWFALSGSEQNGWTAIQFKRLLDTCDTMDVPITVREIDWKQFCCFDVYDQSGTNRLIYAYGLIDPFVKSPTEDITKHFDRGSAVFSLRSYADPPPVSKFSTLDTFEFRLNNVLFKMNVVLHLISDDFLIDFSTQYRLLIRLTTVKYSKHRVIIQLNDMSLQ